MTARLSRCTGCGAQILWRVTEAGKSMPLDPDPAPAAPGTYVLVGDYNCRRSQPMFDPPGTAHYLNHWSSCPDADEFKQPKGKR